MGRTEEDQSICQDLHEPGWPRRTTAGGFRLAIDRSFSATGTGLVVTGTVAAGKVSVGDRLLLSPSRLAARVRGIQVHHEAAESAQAGDRCALAITGPRVEKARLKRGDWLIDPDLHAPTLRIDALVAAVAGKVLKHASRVHVHIGAAGLAGRMLIAGPEGFVTLALERQAVCLYGDRLILRDDSSGRVIAGGHVIDPFPPERRVRRETRALSLQALALPDPAEAFRALLAAEGWAASRRFIQARNLAADFAPETDAIRIGPVSNPILISAATIDTVRARLLEHLRIWHEAHPEQMGPGKAELARGAGSVPAEIAEAVIGVLLEQSDILRDGLAFRLPAHRPVLPPLDAARWIRVRAMLIAADLRPPRVREVATAMVLEPGETETLLIRLERFGLLVRVAPNRFFLPETVVNLGFSAAELAAGTEEAGFTAAEFNKRTGIGRNLTIQVLEHLDAIGVTSRAGDLRHVVRSVQDAVG